MLLYERYLHLEDAHHETPRWRLLRRSRLKRKARKAWERYKTPHRAPVSDESVGPPNQLLSAREDLVYSGRRR
jgi:hypothetical protein